jgi:hypothetical protein
MSATENPNQPIDQSSSLPAGGDLAGLINQMRLQVVGVGLAFLILSLAFNAYVYKQNRNLRMTRDAHNQQIQQMQELEKRVLPAVNDLAGYTVQRPQLRVLFERNGLQLGAGTNQAAAPKR